MSKKKEFGFYRCYACYMGESQHCGGTRLPRKKKKELKRFANTVLINYKFPLFGEPSSCDYGGTYKGYRRYFPLVGFFKKYAATIDLILGDENNWREPEMVMILKDGTWNLHFTWEYDNGLYCTDGSMPLIYEKAKFNETWAGQETNTLLEYFGIPFESVKSDREFVERVYQIVKSGALYGEALLELNEEE